MVTNKERKIGKNGTLYLSPKLAADAELEPNKQYEIRFDGVKFEVSSPRFVLGETFGILKYMDEQSRVHIPQAYMDYLKIRDGDYLSMEYDDKTKIFTFNLLGGILCKDYKMQLQC